eukprot:TRINITY_DN40481_c0_g1_i1.p1 TRINITY_DN40481_c0_g1~~TRINITY_DN40481_c0_g1_i1.p1  ORF type:complete len:346 (+),score=34.01 TRINITY_DN40481_c0_g1_i1:37-1038(+)
MGFCSFVNSLCLTGVFSSFTKRRVLSHGWRDTYFSLGLALFGLVLPFGLVFIKQKPEAYGLLPDGEMMLSSVTSKNTQDEEDAPLRAGMDTGRDDIDVLEQQTEVALEEGSADSSPHPAKIGSPITETPSVREVTVDTNSDFTYAEALRTFGFWSMSAGAFTVAALGTALFFHLDAIFAAYNEHLHVIYLSSAFTAATTSLVSGYLIDRIGAQYIMTCSLLCLSSLLFVAALLLHLRSTFVWLPVVGVLNGLSAGSFSTCLTVSYAKWFGRSHNGKIQGTASSLVVFGSAVGPAALSIGNDVLGTFASALSVLALWPVCCAALTCFTRSPQKT